MESVLVTAGVEAVGSHDNHGEGTLDHIQGIHDIVDSVVLRTLLLDKMAEQLAVR